MGITDVASSTYAWMWNRLTCEIVDWGMGLMTLCLASTMLLTAAHGTLDDSGSLSATVDF